MKRVVSVIVMVVICICAFSGCVKKKTFVPGGTSPAATEAAAEKNTAEPETEPEKTAEEPADKPAEKNWREVAHEMGELAQKEFRLDDITFHLTGMSMDTSEEDTELDPPEGKWVIITLRITDGKIDTEQLNKYLMNDGGITLRGKSPRANTMKGIEIDGDDLYAMGEVILFFDMDKDYGFSASDLEIKQ